MTYDHNDLNGLDQNLDQSSPTSAIKMEKNKDSSIKPKAIVRFSEPIAEYRLISDTSSDSSIYSDVDSISDSWTDSRAIKGLKKCLWKLLIYVCMFIFIVVIVLCGFFSNHSFVQSVIVPIGVFILFCILFYRLIFSSGNYSSGFAQRDNSEDSGYENVMGDLEENLLDYGEYSGYENNAQNVSESLLEENDIKSSI